MPKTRKRSKIRVFDAASGNTRRIRAGTLPDVSSAHGTHISQFPGYDASIRRRRLRLCVDADVSREVVAALNDASIATETAAEAGLENHNDDAIVNWVRRKGSGWVLFSSNHRDFFPEKRYKLHQCPGIVVSGLANDGQNNGLLVNMFLAFVDQLGDNVSKEWWKNTKLKVHANDLLLNQYRNGFGQKYRIWPLTNGQLVFRRRRR